MNDFQETQKRVFDAADKLLEETGRKPTVHQVRRLAGVDMNTTCELMREWKSRQSEKTSLSLNEQYEERLFNGAATLTKEMGETTQSGFSSTLKYYEGERLEKRKKLIARVMAEYYETMDKQLAVFSENKATFQEALRQHDLYLAMQVKAHKLACDKYHQAMMRLWRKERSF